MDSDGDDVSLSSFGGYGALPGPVGSSDGRPVEDSASWTPHDLEDSAELSRLLATSSSSEADEGAEWGSRPLKRQRRRERSSRRQAGRNRAFAPTPRANFYDHDHGEDSDYDDEERAAALGHNVGVLSEHDPSFLSSQEEGEPGLSLGAWTGIGAAGSTPSLLSTASRHDRLYALASADTPPRRAEAAAIGYPGDYSAYSGGSSYSPPPHRHDYSGESSGETPAMSITAELSAILATSSSEASGSWEDDGRPARTRQKGARARLNSRADRSVATTSSPSSLHFLRYLAKHDAAAVPASAVGKASRRGRRARRKRTASTPDDTPEERFEWLAGHTAALEAEDLHSDALDLRVEMVALARMIHGRASLEVALAHHRLSQTLTHVDDTQAAVQHAELALKVRKGLLEMGEGLRGWDDQWLDDTVLLLTCLAVVLPLICLAVVWHRRHLVAVVRPPTRKPSTPLCMASGLPT